MKIGRLSIWAVIILLLTSSSTAAQEPPLAPFFTPSWKVDVAADTMALFPPTAHLAVGIDEANVALHVIGDSLTSSPNTGSLIIGPTTGPHMQFDRNDIRVAGSRSDTFGALYFQRYGGPIVVHGSGSLESRIYMTTDGDLGVATADPRQFALDRSFVGPAWSAPPGAIAVDGDVYSDRVACETLDVLDRVRIGRPGTPSLDGAAIDALHVDAILQVAGKISAQQIVVHIDNWADDVFSDDYELMSLRELSNYTKAERHLPGLPSADQVTTEGIDLAQTNAMLLRKIEELTLHIIEQERRIDALEDKISAPARE